ncbi:MAG: TetR family transcriptional regulator [Kofleriaceae bacterium]
MDREQKKRETRQRISDVATTLFAKRGFDAVTVEDIAAAADVSKMTVFNYFPRKEDLHFDRDEDLMLLPFREALAKGTRSVSTTVRAVIVELRDRDHELVRVHPRAGDWWRVVRASPALQARLHEIEDAAAASLAEVIGGAKPDSTARLIAGMLVLAVRTAREEGVRVLDGGGSVKKATATLLGVLECGLEAIAAIE